MITSNDPQVVIRTARKDWSCACVLRKHRHTGRPFGMYAFVPGEPDARQCENVIRKGDRYPEYLGDAAAYESGSRYCPECRVDQLGDMISEA